ncbi:AAA family ATPase [Exiguobacterium sp. Leaf187]|uniref:ATP-binding protein n=1 Tax=unclassified Exiguobacterium TaxID=2644629 RepID=UPI0006F4FFAC|nr:MULTISPECIES: ATP-binding protein [unclassified Exiguobacterium]KQS18519.1 AAA family ATPase [Exiguobacterium sp. Leaf187]
MENINNHLIALVRAALENDKRVIELSTISIIRKTKKSNQDLSKNLSELLSIHNAGSSFTRSVGVQPPPTDKESFLSLLKVEDSSIFEENLILEKQNKIMIDNFLKERKNSKLLIENGIQPPKSILLYGPPGVGKTSISKYIAKMLDLPLVTLDLSAAISSYLGKTGQNLKKVLEFGKENPSVLLLDEFDSIAKKRDDSTDLGELKRIVNVLLKELEEWPPNSIIIGATNFPEFLDKAIWRRFDIKIDIPLPSKNQRINLWNAYLNNELIKIDENLIEIVSKLIVEISPSDIKQISEYILRRVIIDDENPSEILISRIKEFYSKDNSTFNKEIIKALKQTDVNITQAKLAEILSISPSTVNHHLKALTI